jgi:hypothetical protein
MKFENVFEITWDDGSAPTRVPTIVDALRAGVHGGWDYQYLRPDLHQPEVWHVMRAPYIRKCDPGTTADKVYAHVGIVRVVPNK